MSSTLVSHRCGHCGGSLRADAPWCTLCLTPTRPAAAPEAVPEALPEHGVVASAGHIDPLTAPLELLLGAPAGPIARPRHGRIPTWPCVSCATDNDLELTACATCGAGFLAVVAREEAPLLVLPLVGDVSQWRKLHWLGAGVVLLLVLLVVIMTAGALLG